MELRWDKCPICESLNIKRKNKDIIFEIKGKKINIPKVNYHECSDCKEKFFDYRTNKKIDEYFIRQGKKVVIS